jgi:hypothetical protein
VDLVFFDNFEYTVDRNDVNAANLFRQQGGWAAVKTEQSGEPGANGYLYTVASIPGYTGAFPGGGSSRVLAMEALPYSQLFQTDFYLQYGDGENATYNEAIPGNVWFQFWIYINHTGDQLSRISEGKFIYPCNTAYPCHSNKWLLTTGGWSALPLYQSLGEPTNGDIFLNNPVSLDTTAVTNANFPSWDAWKLGQTNTSEYMAANRWTLVKIHLDTSTQSGRYEAWMRHAGSAWIKVVEWIDGVTPAGFTWRINADQVGGHRVIRMPSTIGSANPAGQNYDAWFYMDDFAIARSEAGLPVYQ